MTAGGVDDGEHGGEELLHLREIRVHLYLTESVYKVVLKSRYQYKFVN